MHQRKIWLVISVCFILPLSPLSFPACLPSGWLSVQPQAPGEQPGRVLLQPDRHLVQPGGLPTGVLGGSEPAADLPLLAQEKHRTTGAPPSAQGEEKPRADRRGFGLPGRARGAGGKGGGNGDGNRNRGRGWRTQRVPGETRGSIQPRPLERALLQPGQPPERRDSWLRKTTVAFS